MANSNTFLTQLPEPGACKDVASDGNVRDVRSARSPEPGVDRSPAEIRLQRSAASGFEVKTAFNLAERFGRMSGTLSGNNARQTTPAEGIASGDVVVRRGIEGTTRRRTRILEPA